MELPPYRLCLVCIPALGILYVTGFYVALAVYASLRSFIKVMYVHVECKYGETGTPITDQYLHRSTAYCAMCVAV